MNFSAEVKSLNSTLVIKAEYYGFYLFRREILPPDEEFIPIQAAFFEFSVALTAQNTAWRNILK